jgi:transposase
MADVGRPTDFTSDHVRQAKKLAVLGMSNKSIAEFFGIAESTLYEWQKDHSEFKEALKKGKVDADSKVAAKLYKRALGFTIRETTYERTGRLMNLQAEDGSKTTEDEYRKKVVIKRVLPDVTAQTAWLRARQPETWRENKSIDHNFSGPVSFSYNEQPGNEPIADE